MAHFGSTKRDSSWEEWKEQLITMLEINDYNPDFSCDFDEFSDTRAAYERGTAVDDYFYDNFEVDE